MYIPLYISFLYIYISVRLQLNNYTVKNKEVRVVSRNILATELLWYVGHSYILTYLPSFSLLNLILFFIAQDIYFYSVHYLLHKYFYSIHATHHSIYGPFYAWYSTAIEHILLNLGSIAVPFILFPNSSLTFICIITLQMYTSINGHTDNSPHSKHHADTRKRLGSIYLVDRFMDSY
jgi:hypothetical protein